MTEEEIQNANVGEARKHNATIHLEKYSDQWPILFNMQKQKIVEALSHLSINVEHVGSTSVPSLCAKPIIDIALEVPDSSKEDDYVAALEKVEFWLKIREPDWFEHRMFKHTSIPTNLHVFTSGCPEVQKMISFRDHLRACDSDLKLYQAKKQELAKIKWDYMQNHADAKSEVVGDIMNRAIRG